MVWPVLRFRGGLAGLRGWAGRLGRAAVLVAAWAAPSAAQPAPPLPPGLDAIGDAVVHAVIDGDTVVLDDGRQVRLVGIQAPKLPLGRTGFAAWPLSDEARVALADLVEGQAVRLYVGGRAEDRHGRLLAHVERAVDGLWIQDALLRRGLARVYTFADNRAAADALYAAERAARAEDRGIWALPYYAVRTPEGVGADIGSFQVVVGRVLDAAEVRGRLYLNFGEDWRTDFTVTVPPAAVDLFAAAGLDPLALEGRWIRVRGWVDSYNGPVITADHPQMIEVGAPR